MAGITIELEYLWSANYQPWISTSYPWKVLSQGAKSIALSQINPTIIQGQGVTFNHTVDSLVISVQNPTITEGQGLIVSPTVESFTLSIQNPTITEGLGKVVDVSAESLILSSQNPNIEYDYTIDVETQNVSLSFIPPSKVGLLWTIRIQPTEKWKTRNQVLWSYDIFPWLSTFYPWQVVSKLTENVFTTRTKPTTNYTNRTKPTSNWSNRTKPATDWK